MHRDLEFHVAERGGTLTVVGIDADGTMWDFGAQEPWGYIDLRHLVGTLQAADVLTLDEADALLDTALHHIHRST